MSLVAIAIAGSPDTIGQFVITDIDNPSCPFYPRDFDYCIEQFLGPQVIADVPVIAIVPNIGKYYFSFSRLPYPVILLNL